VTLTKNNPPLDAESVEQAVELLRERGLRASSARRLVLEALFAAEGPISAERVAEGIAGRVPPSDLASVYRNLETLEAAGLVRHVHLGHSPGLYALSGATDREYLVCESCAAVRAVESAELDDVREAVRERFGYVPHFSHFPLVGLCPDCTT